jgi:hypothetical protein
MPTLIILGDNGQIVLVSESVRISTQPIRNTTLKVCPGLPRITGTSSTAAAPPPF